MQAGSVCFPSDRSLCEATVCQLATLGKVKGEGITPEVSLGVLIFVSGTHLPGFISSTSGFSRWLGQEQEAPSPVIFSEKGMQTTGICFGVKIGFSLYISKLKFWLCFAMFPGVCLAFGLGGAGTSFTPHK